MKNKIDFEQRYAGLQPKRFISLSEQINQLYEGPWVQMGAYPEDGTNNPNPSDQEKARKMWRNVYKKLKPFESFIYEDYLLCKENEWEWSSEWEYSAVMAMHDLCESYHNIVELWDEIQTQIDDEEVVFSPVGHEIVPYDSESAVVYFEQKNALFKAEYLPKAIARLKKWLQRIPDEKREEAIGMKLEMYEKEMRRSGFLEFYMADITPGFMEEVLPLADSQDMAQRMMDDEQYACDMYDLHDGIDVLNMEKLEQYVWEHQKCLKDEQLFSFLLYEEMKCYLPKLKQTPLAKFKAFLDSLTVSLEFDPLSMAPTVSIGRANERQDSSAAEGKDVKKQIELPVYFASELRANKRASEALIGCLNDMAPRINVLKGNRSEKWQWPHLRAAFIVLKLVDKDINPTDFGKAINTLLPSRSAASVKQSFKYGRINSDFPNVADKSIIAEMVKRLESVKKYME